MLFPFIIVRLKKTKKQQRVQQPSLRMRIQFNSFLERNAAHAGDAKNKDHRWISVIIGIDIAVALPRHGQSHQKSHN